MIRVALLGSDSTHTEAFANLMNRPDAVFGTRARVVSIWGEDPSQTARKAEALGIPRCADTIPEALNEVDLAMVIGRFGDSHYEPARIALDHGLPTFVDKPFTTDVEQARALIHTADSIGGRIVSSSPLRFARELSGLSNEGFRPGFVSVSAPANCVDLGDDRRLKSVFFYGIHAVEILLELMGHDVRDVRVLPGKQAITIQAEFSTGTGSVQLIRDADEFYTVYACGRHEQRHMTISLDGSYYPRMLDFLLDQFYPGFKTIPVESTLQGIALLEKTEQVDLGTTDDA